MKQNRDVIYIGDILDAIRRIEGYTSGVKKKEFLEHLMMQDAVMGRLKSSAKHRTACQMNFKKSIPNCLGFK